MHIYIYIYIYITNTSVFVFGAGGERLLLTRPSSAFASAACLLQALEGSGRLSQGRRVGDL